MAELPRPAIIARRLGIKRASVYRLLEKGVAGLAARLRERHRFAAYSADVGLPPECGLSERSSAQQELTGPENPRSRLGWCHGARSRQRRTSLAYAAARWPPAILVCRNVHDGVGTGSCLDLQSRLWRAEPEAAREGPIHNW